MAEPLNQDLYTSLKDAILAFVANHANPAVQPFKDGIARWGDEWCGGDAAYLKAAEFLAPALPSANDETREITLLFEQAKSALKWEQSYTKADAVVGSDMLDGYGFVEVIGKNGPFVSTRVRSGIGVWGPDIDYPVHRHEAEEIYVPLAGSAVFELDGQEPQVRRVGDVVHVPSMLAHGFRTTDDPLVVFYVWQDGNLREKSAFL